MKGIPLNNPKDADLSDGRQHTVELCVFIVLPIDHTATLLIAKDKHYIFFYQNLHNNTATKSSFQ